MTDYELYGLLLEWGCDPNKENLNNLKKQLLTEEEGAAEGSETDEKKEDVTEISEDDVKKLKKNKNATIKKIAKAAGKVLASAALGAAIGAAAGKGVSSAKIGDLEGGRESTINDLKSSTQAELDAAANKVDTLTQHKDSLEGLNKTNAELKDVDSKISSHEKAMDDLGNTSKSSRTASDNQLSDKAAAENKALEDTKIKGTDSEPLDDIDNYKNNKISKQQDANTATAEAGKTNTQFNQHKAEADNLKTKKAELESTKKSYEDKLKDDKGEIVGTVKDKDGNLIDTETYNKNIEKATSERDDLISKQNKDVADKNAEIDADIAKAKKITGKGAAIGAGVGAGVGGGALAIKKLTKTSDDAAIIELLGAPPKESGKTKTVKYKGKKITYKVKRYGSDTSPKYRWVKEGE